MVLCSYLNQCLPRPLLSLRCNGLTHWGRDKMAVISQTILSNAFSWMKILEFRLKISLKFVPESPINNIPPLVQIMAWRRPGDKPLTEPMVVRLLTHICVTRPQWVNTSGAETGLLQDNKVITVAADALAPCTVRTSANMVLTIQDKWIFAFHEEGFQLPTPIMC